MAAEGIEGRAMGGDVDQGAVVVLAVDLDHELADALQQGGGDRLVVDEGARTAVGQLHAAEDDVLVVGDVVVAQGLPRRMLAGQLQDGHHLAALGTVAHQGRVAAPAEGEGQGIEQDGLAGPGLAGERRQPGIQGQIELVDEDDVANR